MMGRYLTRRDINKLISIMGIGEDEINKKLTALRSIAYNHWVDLARKGLHTTKRDYINAIKYGDFKYAKYAVILLTSDFAEMVENGKPAFNLRDTLLKTSTRSIKRSKKGFLFLHVPYRHKVKDIGEPYKKAGFKEIEVARLKREINKKRKKLIGTTTKIGGEKTDWGERLKTENVPLLRERHKTNIYESMTRMQKFYKSKAQAFYMTFRTISQNPESIRSDKGGKNWSHPGIKPHMFAEKTQKYMESKIDEVMDW